MASNKNLRLFSVVDIDNFIYDLHTTTLNRLNSSNVHLSDRIDGKPTQLAAEVVIGIRGQQL